jgi:anti-sigma factor RsiW
MNLCPKQDDLVLYVAEELPRGEAAALDQHLAGCESCRRQVARLRRGLRALSLLEREPAVRPQAMESLNRLLHEAARAQTRRPAVFALFARPRWLAAAAAVLLGAGLGWLAWDALHPAATTPAPTTTAMASAWLTPKSDPLEEVTAAVELLVANMGPTGAWRPAATPRIDETKPEALDDADDDAIDEMNMLLDYLSGETGSQG